MRNWSDEQAHTRLPILALVAHALEQFYAYMITFSWKKMLSVRVLLISVQEIYLNSLARLQVAYTHLITKISIIMEHNNISLCSPEHLWKKRNYTEFSTSIRLWKKWKYTSIQLNNYSMSIYTSLKKVIIQSPGSWTFTHLLKKWNYTSAFKFYIR